MPNITVANGGNGNLISGQAFTFYSSRTGNITLNLALSDFNATNHTIKITANWT